MKKCIFVLFLALASTFGFSSTAMAQAPDCSDVVWDADILAANPTMADHCLEVVQRDGAWYARMRAKVVRQGATSTVVRYQDQNGDFGASERTYPPRGFTAQIDGKDVKISDLPPGQEVNVYVISENNFTVRTASAPAAAPVMVEEEVVEEVVEEPAPAMLPTTAGQTYWLAILGTLLVLMGGIVHAVRSRG